MKNKKRLFIVGAGGFGREIEMWLQLLPLQERNWEIAGYLDDNAAALNGYPSDYKILGGIEYFDFMPDDLAIMAIADTMTKERIYHKLQSKVSFFTYIAPNSMIGKFTQIGEGCIIFPNCLISTNVIVGKCVVLNTGTQIGHDVKIDNFTSLMASVNIGGGCTLEKNVYIGTGATVIPQKVIGANAKIGAGSVVIRNVKENTTVFGNPAKIIN